MRRTRPEGDGARGALALTFPGGERVEGVVELGEPVAAEKSGEPLPSRQVVGPGQDAISRFAGRALTFLWAEQHATDRGARGGTLSLVSPPSLRRPPAEAGAAGPAYRRPCPMRFRMRCSQ